jgi:hypothetical protein
MGNTADADRLPSQGMTREVPPREQALAVHEDEMQCIQESLAAPSSPARAAERKDAPARPRTRRPKQAVVNGQGSGAPLHTALSHTAPDDAQRIGVGAPKANPAPHHDEEAARPAADAARPIGASAPADNADLTSVGLTRCGWCGGTQFLAISKELGHILCECRSVYNPRHRCWSPGVESMRQSPPASIPVTPA